MASVPKAQVGVPGPYTKGLVPLLPGGSEMFLQNELTRLHAALDGILLMVPQSATEVPQKLMDGMSRLSRYPWRPVAGQLADAWVYWDGAGQLWRLLSTAPTNTP